MLPPVEVLNIAQLVPEKSFGAKSGLVSLEWEGKDEKTDPCRN